MGAAVKILCILLLLLHKSSQQETFNDQKTLNLPETYTWMADLDDETLLSKITIPGTHETMALHGFLPGVKCQSWSLEDQLKAGIRYLDLRVSGKDLEIVHGLFSQKANFSQAFAKVKKFLSDFPTETVLVRLKHRQKKFPDNVTSQLKNDPKCWVSNAIPRIKEVRGKVVFVQKNDFKLGVPLIQTDKNGDYKVKNIEKKKGTIGTHLGEAVAASKDRDVVLTYSSGTGWPTLKLKYTPKNVAKEINPWLYQYLQNQYSKNNPKPCFGIIAMDFPGLDLIRKVIEFNKKVFNSP